jgi:thioredoxin reductase
LQNATVRHKVGGMDENAVRETPAEAWDVVVVGGGPAGLSAALMLGRARRRVVVVDAGEPRNRFAAHMHGVLGHEGLDPAELAARGREEVAAYGVQVRRGLVERVDREPDHVRVTLADGAALVARALVVATGLSDELPDVPGLAQRWGTGVLHCPYCHGWEVRDARLGVLLLSQAGLHQAEMIRQWSDRVTVFAGAVEVEPDVERRLRARGVEVVASPVLEVLGDGDAVTGVRTADGRVTSVDAIFTAPRPRPQDAFLAGLDLARTDSPWGSLVAVDPTGRTSDGRVWAVGNVVNPMANVPLAMGTGSFVGGAVNGALVTEEFDAAVAGAVQRSRVGA